MEAGAGAADPHDGALGHELMKAKIWSSGKRFWDWVLHCGFALSDAFIQVALGRSERSLYKLCFVVLEVCGGSGGISASWDARGVQRGAVIELKAGFYLWSEDIFNWVLRLCLAGRVWVLIF